MTWRSEQKKAWRGEVFLAVIRVLGFMRKSRPLRGTYYALLERLIKRTGLFDASHYLEINSDVAEAGASPLRHYVVFGDREGRAPIGLFDPVFYRSQLKGRDKSINALLHYVHVGRYRHLSPSPWFDVDFYLSKNRDLIFADVEPLRHYLKFGGLEGRSPSAQFDGSYYLRTNPDVLAARENPLLHYLRCGHLEGRRPLPLPQELVEDDQILEPESDVLEWDGWAEQTPRAAGVDVAVDVIVPVYKGRVETLACLRSVLSASCQTPFELIVINDASPDPMMASDLERLSELGLFTLLVNDDNRGFVHTVNRGMARHDQRDVVLVNADTKVFDGWLDRMLLAASRHDRTGTVTPLSNNATICSYPRTLHDNPYPLEVDYATLDAIAAEVNQGLEAEAPTAVGFCTLIRRACLNEVGLFDEATFGRGYGEENDFSQRAIAKGWRNIIAADVFVYHRGSTSFQGEKGKRVQAAMALLDRRYPNYHRQVADFIANDPLAEARSRLDWARLIRLTKPKNVLIVVHGRGGGTERHVQEDIHVLTREGYGVFLLRPLTGRPTHVTLSHAAAKSLPNLEPYEIADTHGLSDALRALRISDVHTHSLIDVVPDAPKHITQIIRAVGARWEVNLHDYKVICPRINLADPAGRYCGEPDDTSCNRCVSKHGSVFGRPEIGAWRVMHRKALQSADRVLVPDEDMSDRLSRYFPDVFFEVSPHEEVDPEFIAAERPVIGRHEKLHIVVVGAISRIKGYDVLRSCASDASRRKLPLRFSLMGYSINDTALSNAGVSVTGRYTEQEAADRLAGLEPHIVWLPALWPETYSYTLSLALRCRYPISAFDIGAIGSRLRRLGQGDCLMPLDMADSPRNINRWFEAFRRGEVCVGDRVAPRETAGSNRVV